MNQKYELGPLMLRELLHRPFYMQEHFWLSQDPSQGLEKGENKVIFLNKRFESVCLKLKKKKVSNEDSDYVLYV